MDDPGFFDLLWNRRQALEWATAGYSTINPRWGFRGRVLEEHLLYLVSRDHFIMDLGQGQVSVGPDDLLWLPPGQAHDFALPPGHETMSVYHFRFALQGDDGSVPANPVLLRQVAHLRPLVQALWEEHRLRLPGSTERQRALLIALLSAVLRERAETPTDASTGFTTAQRLKLLDWFETQVHGRPSPTDIAQLLGLSEDYCSRRFRATFGCPPRQWLVRERIRHAAMRLVTTQEDIGTVAECYGYNDLFLFSRQFKQVTGESPRQYRRTHSGPRQLP